MLVGMSQERLGELLGLTFQQVQKYEKGIYRIGAGRLFEVAGILAAVAVVLLLSVLAIFFVVSRFISLDRVLGQK